MGTPRRQWGVREEAYSPVCTLNEAASLCLVPPEFIGDSDPLTNVTAALHSPLTLLCEATGVPPPGVRWFRGEEPVSLGEDTYLLAGEEPARGVSGDEVWPFASVPVYHTPETSDPDLPGRPKHCSCQSPKRPPQTPAEWWAPGKMLDLNKCGNRPPAPLPS